MQPSPFQTRQLIVFAALLFGVSQMVSASNPLEWLGRMQKAVHLLDYEGRFVYQSGSHIESMYIVHRVHGEQELERLVALDGEPREVVRGNHAMAFLKPGQRPINVQETPNQYAHNQNRSLNHKLDYQQLAAHYAIQFAGQSRVAGRIAKVVEISPKDNLRYGHRLYLDQATALPLKSVLLDTGGELLSQNLFVELKVGEDITPIEYDVSALSHIPGRPCQAKTAAPAKQTAWVFAGLPKGYKQQAYRRQSAEKREHFIFSDGLGSISLYIEQPGQTGIAGHSSMGATHTLAMEKHGRQIMLIGEAPIRALQQLAEALQRHD